MHLRYLFNIYYIQDRKPYDWSSLVDKAIEDEDLHPLDISIELFCDSHVLLSELHHMR